MRSPTVCGHETMSNTITAMSWNVQGEIGIGDARMQRQLDVLNEYASEVDLFMFQAVNYEENPAGSRQGQLGCLVDYFLNRNYHLVHTGDWAQELAASNIQPHADIEGAHNRCNLIASRWPVDRHPLTLRNRGERKPRKLDYYYSHFPEKMLVAEVDLSDDTTLPADKLELWNVGIINGANWGEEKLNMLETVYGRIYLQTTKADVPVLLGGDFNAPKRETGDGEIIPHGENVGQYRNYPYYGDPQYFREASDEVTELRFNQRWQRTEALIFDSGMSDWGMRDVYWAATESQQESSTKDFTHIVHSGNPSKKRLDHILVSEQFNVRHCEIWNGRQTMINGLDASDHAPVVTKLRLE